jgi:LmbE family N-acetylglucosaminyl deacetylase
VAYLTDGAGKVPASARNAESLRALRSLGVPAESCAFLGTRIPDLHLADNLLEAERLLAGAVRRWSCTQLTRVYCPAWEGGHPDHDAAQLIALEIAARFGARDACWEYSLYNGYGAPRGLFRVISPLPRPSEQKRWRLPRAQAFRLTILIRHYPSQWRTWLGLAPELVARRLLLRRASIQKAHASAVFDRPHPGRLLYENMGRGTFEDFMQKTQGFRDRLAVNESDR